MKLFSPILRHIDEQQIVRNTKRVGNFRIIRF